MHTALVRLFVLAIMVPAISSCAATSKKFSSQTKANIGFFADHTISMLSDADFGVTRTESVYTREFFDLEGEEEKRSAACFHLDSPFPLFPFTPRLNPGHDLSAGSSK